MSLLHEALDACSALARRVEHLEQDKVAQDLEIIKLNTKLPQSKLLFLLPDENKEWLSGIQRRNHLQKLLLKPAPGTREKIVPDEDDDIFTEATPLARKVPVVDYQVILVNNKPRYKIIKVDDTHQLYASFITMLKIFDREDLKTLWKIVKERFSTSKPNNFSDEYLLTALKTMFERPDGQDNVWKNQSTVHGQALVKS
nr:hypothetical protein [Tanacetum cinerariifolium]